MSVQEQSKAKPSFFTLLKKVPRKSLELTSIVYFKERNIFLERPITPPTEQLPDGVSFRNTGEDPDFLKHISRKYPHKLRLFTERLNIGLTCFPIYLGKDDLGGYVWFAESDYYEPKYKCTFPVKPKQVYQFDGFIDPKYRNQKIPVKALPYFWKYFSAKGFINSLVIVDMANTKNLKLHAHLGYRETGKILETHFLLGKPFSIFKDYSGNILK